MRPFYWLAGARWETLRQCDATERERIAVIGSAVLIPTIMAFLGMLVLFEEPFCATALAGVRRDRARRGRL